MLKVRFDFMLNIIDKALKDYLSAYDKMYKHKLFEAVEYSLLLTGKRLRPILCLEFSNLCGGSYEDAMPFACGIEMIHAYSLIHDDLPCMDNDELRRGNPTNHMVFGEGFALLAGDALLNMGFETILNANLPPERVVEASKVISNCSGINGMIGGQAIDMLSEGRELDFEELKAMDMGKTVGLLRASSMAGVLAAGGDKKALEAADKYAINFGMAFQIRDDILDVIGNKEELGKNTGADEKLNKCNYVKLLGIKQGQKLVEEYTKKAVEALDVFEKDTTKLEELAVMMKERSV